MNEINEGINKLDILLQYFFIAVGVMPENLRPAPCRSPECKLRRVPKPGLNRGTRVHRPYPAVVDQVFFDHQRTFGFPPFHDFGRYGDKPAAADYADDFSGFMRAAHKPGIQLISR